MRALVGMCLAAAVAVGQEGKQLVAELADAKRAEGAATELLAMGERAVPALQQLFEEWDVSTEQSRGQLRAAMQVAGLMQRAGGPLKAVLVDLVATNDGGNFRQGRNRDAALVPDVMDAIASLSPYGEKVEFHHLFHFTVVGGKEHKGKAFAAVFRYRERDEAKIETVEQARRALEENKIFAREVAAEVLGEQGTIEDAALLRDRLLLRDERPKGWDGLKHNGFVVPTRDRFGLAAGLALVRLAPTDSVSAIGHAMIAAHHPFAKVRKRSLLALTSFGPYVAVAIPELMAIAAGDDAALAGEALKVLGIAGKDVGAHLRTIDRLAKHESAFVSRIAESLAVRLRAMGCPEPAAEIAVDAPPEGQAELRAAVDVLADERSEQEKVAAAERKVAAAPEAAWPLLMERLRRDFQSAPEALIRSVAELGTRRAEQERLEIRGILVHSGDRWSAPYFSSSSGGRAMTDAQRDAYGTLTVGAPDELGDVAAFLVDENAAVRLAAARLCARRAAEVANAGTLADALGEAVVGEHPAKSTFQLAENHRTTRNLDLAAEIRAAASAALRQTEQPVDRHDELLRHALRHAESAAVAEAIERFGPKADRADLERAAADEGRPDVAAAARKVLAQRGDR